MDVKFLEVADDDPARIFAVGKEACIAPRLLEGGQDAAVGLFRALVQRDVHALLLDQDAGCGNVAVDEAGMAQLDRQLEIDISLRRFHAVDLLQQ